MGRFKNLHRVAVIAVVLSGALLGACSNSSQTSTTAASPPPPAPPVQAQAPVVRG